MPSCEIEELLKSGQGSSAPDSRTPAAIPARSEGPPSPPVGPNEELRTVRGANSTRGSSASAPQERIEQGMPVKAEIEFRRVRNRPATAEKRLDAFCHDASMELLLVNREPKSPSRSGPMIRPPCMPVSDDGKQVEKLDRPVKWKSTFPLATVWTP